MKVFVDTGAWLATEIGNDSFHQEAKQYRLAMEKKRAQVFTNGYVLAETYTRLIYDVHLNAAQQFRDKILAGAEEGALAVLEVDASVRQLAWEELQRYSDHQLSFTDATIIAQFKQFRLDEIFTFDTHFADINLPTNLEN